MPTAAYPTAPGWKREGTSREAAESIAPKAMSLRARVFEVIKRRPSTPEEVAAALNEPVHNIRPRVSEGVARGLYEETGERRIAMGGRMASVWRVRA